MFLGRILTGAISLAMIVSPPGNQGIVLLVVLNHNTDNVAPDTQKPPHSHFSGCMGQVGRLGPFEGSGLLGHEYKDCDRRAMIYIGSHGGKGQGHVA